MNYDNYFATKATLPFTARFEMIVPGEKNPRYIRTSRFSCASEMFEYIDRNDYDVVNVELNEKDATVIYNE